MELVDDIINACEETLHGLLGIGREVVDGGAEGLAVGRGLAEV